MSQTKIDQYKQEKANRKANAKKARTKKKLTLFVWIGAGVVVAGLLIWGIVATVQDGGLTTIKNKKEENATKQLLTQEFVDYLNSASTTTEDAE